MYLDDDAFLSIPRLVDHLSTLEAKFGTGDGEEYSDVRAASGGVLCACAQHFAH